MSLKPGHDGSIALIEDGRLVYSVEAEKDSFLRFGETSPSLFATAAQMSPGVPDVLAISGWEKGGGETPAGHQWGVGAGYYGLDNVLVEASSFFGTPIKLYSTSHERA